MNNLRRSLVLLACGLGSQVASAKPASYPGTFLDHVGMITTTWWVTTLVATILFGILLGFFVYRNAVGNGRASGATGAGCLVAVIVFLICQLGAIAILAATLFNLPVVSTTQTKTTTTTPAPSSDAGSAPAKKPDSPAKNNGDDF